VNRKSRNSQFETPASRLIKRLARDYMRQHKAAIAIAVGCMLIVAAMTGLQARLLEPALDRVLVEGDVTLAWLLPLAYLGISVTKGFASFGQTVLMQRTGLGIIATMQKDMFDRVIESDFKDIHADATGTLLARFTNDVTFTKDAIVKCFTGIGRDLFAVIVLAGVMLHTHWKMALIALLVFPVSLFPILYIGRRMRRISADTQHAIGLQTTFLDEAFKGFRQVKAYGMERFERSRASDIFEQVFRLHYKAGRTRSRTYPVMESLGGFAIAAILAWGGAMVLHGETTVGQFMAFLAAVLLAYQPLRSLANLNAGLQHGLAAAERVFKMIDYRPSIADAPDARALERRDGRVRLAGVHFAYAEDRPALRDVTIDVPAGRTVALVGPSGAGKSTILNLIPRFYDAQQGRVEIDGQDVKSVTLRSLRHAIAYVGQDVTLFNDTIRANILYGRPDATDDDVAAAATAAAADGFIGALPEGYDTVVGERGLRLSGGQRQRIAIARAMLRDAPILLLDEATSALDSESERQVQAALARLMKDRTTIVIAHRLSTVANADRIYVIDGGAVVGEGTHAALLESNDVYARLCRMQFEDSAGLGEAGPSAPHTARA
jgi:subfamily B ATP-binding cassette protein MsbA